MAAREPAAPKNSEADPQTGEANPPTVPKASAGSEDAAHPLSETS
jgi:hypothetical protein